MSGYVLGAIIMGVALFAFAWRLWQVDRSSAVLLVVFVAAMVAASLVVPEPSACP